MKLNEIAARLTNIGNESIKDSCRHCKRCKGKRQVESLLAKGHMEQCYACSGVGFYFRPDFGKIFLAIASDRGGRLRIKEGRPPYGREIDPLRAYYVWRMYRFHGGIDVTMPVCATMDVTHDPYENELDELASVLAKIMRGTDMAGSLRWGPLLGGITQEQADEYRKKHPQPMTAEPCGPVVIGPKPEEERPELY